MSDSHEDTKARRGKEEISSIIVDCAFRLHCDLGPGLLENVYEVELKSVEHLAPVHAKQLLTSILFT